MIWKRDISIEAIKERSLNTMSDYVGIRWLEIGDDFIKASMPVDHRTQQPLGYLNGGASCVLAETIGSTAANYAVDKNSYCVGLDINANHLRSAQAGDVISVAMPLHLGSRTQVWEIKIFQEEKLCCISRLTMAVLKK